MTSGMSDTNTDIKCNHFVGLSQFSYSETLNANAKTPNISEALTALRESNRQMQTALSQDKIIKLKVYVPMPKKFDEKVGDFMKSQLEQLETQF